MDSNTLTVCLALIQAIVTIAGYFTGYTLGRRTNGKALVDTHPRPKTGG